MSEPPMLNSGPPYGKYNLERTCRHESVDD